MYALAVTVVVVDTDGRYTLSLYISLSLPITIRHSVVCLFCCCWRWALTLTNEIHNMEFAGVDIRLGMLCVHILINNIIRRKNK